MSAFTESVVEKAALAWLESLGWAVAHGRDIAPDTPGGVCGRACSPRLVLYPGDSALKMRPRSMPAGAYHT